MARARPFAALMGGVAPLLLAAAIGLGSVPSPAAAADKLVKIGLLAQVTGKSSADAQESIRGIYVVLADHGRVYASDGCNRVSGTYEPKKTSVRFRAVAASQMACILWQSCADSQLPPSSRSV